MPLEAQWMISDQVILITARGPVTIEDFETIAETLITLFDQCHGPTLPHLLLDLARATSLPLRLERMTTIMHTFLAQIQGFHSGAAIIYGTDDRTFLQLLNTLATMSGRMFRFAADEAQALALLRDLDPTLRPLLNTHSNESYGASPGIY